MSSYISTFSKLVALRLKCGRIWSVWGLWFCQPIILKLFHFHFCINGSDQHYRTIIRSHDLTKCDCNVRSQLQLIDTCKWCLIRSYKDIATKLRDSIWVEFGIQVQPNYGIKSNQLLQFKCHESSDLCSFNLTISVNNWYIEFNLRQENLENQGFILK